MIRDILHPGTTCRIYTVEFNSWGGGWFKSFWLKRSALKFAEKNGDSCLQVVLTNEITEKRTILKEFPEDIDPPVVYGYP